MEETPFLPPDGSTVRITCTLPAYNAGVWVGRLDRSRGGMNNQDDFVTVAEKPRFHASSSSTNSANEHFHAGLYQIIIEIDGGDVDFRREMDAVTRALNYRSALEARGVIECSASGPTVSGYRSSHESVALIHNYHEETDDEDPAEIVGLYEQGVGASSRVEIEIKDNLCHTHDIAL